MNEQPEGDVVRALVSVSAIVVVRPGKMSVGQAGQLLSDKLVRAVIATGDAEFDSKLRVDVEVPYNAEAN